MDGKKFRTQMGDLAMGTALNAAARDYQKEMLAEYKAQSSQPKHEEVDIDDLLNDPELERLHAERINAMKREAEKRQKLQQQGYGEYRLVTEGDFLTEVTKSPRVICHFFHREFIRCKIMDKHLKLLTPKYFDTKFICIDAENCPFFVTKLGIKVLPCVILFRDGVAVDRIVGFQELGGVDDFATKALESRLLKADLLVPKRAVDEDGEEKVVRTVRSTVYADSDSE
ncbi:thioredoxin domain-containing protein PLP3B isoform X2 [Physcomitrium patens]|uniref:Thioredoxin domain-containing protein n=1 Tax=Physcomitrium patens TaxID=3218 RepID=A9SCL1_PHYPA|nr:thioredoxin domain-containing protein PLP3A-like isoform X2 [Physcomitrium patens]PNR36550.1 hypothetical protein PHYPA_022401 [Physcomitrium patens]|eukprot:XP_024401539.1 thioredoxin domain-containing protein PLP3A-like isoform X2 [Physcomitrella patens]